MARWVARTLVSHGVPIFLAPSHLIGAQQWQDEVLKALQPCDWFMVLLSPQAVDSMWVRREVAFALYEKRYRERIIPLTYKPCDMTPVEWLNLSQKVDFSGNFESGCRDLLRSWGIGLRPITT